HDFCFVHVADLHLDTPFRGLSAAAPEVAGVLRDASLAAFDAVVDLALERRAAFLLVAGDVYDGPERGLRAQLRFRDGLARLSAAGVASFVVHGNHDPLETGWSAIGAWPAATTVFPSSSVEVVPVLRAGEVIATVQGISFATRSTTENLALRLRRPDRPGRGRLEATAGDGAGRCSPVHVGLLHCNVEGSPGEHADYSPCTLSDLRATKLDYLALGHVHQRSVLAEGAGPGDPWVVYPGALQAHSWRAGERGAKGAYVVHVEGGAISHLEFVPCDQVRFDEVACRLEGLSELGEVADLLSRFADEASRRAEGRALVLRAELCGAGPLHCELARPGVRDDLLSHLRDEARGRPSLCWWDSLRDTSTAPRDLALLAGRGDFAADLLEVGRAALEDAALGEALAGHALSGLPRQLAQRVGELLGEPSRRAELLGRAAERALDELVLDPS
ncbi:MAG TPA: DNA repair exonuclease, partial [Acidimicrobiales bacterium]|nr:DNA repair exonuclease [Acidimicrobiales bacterium]